MHCIYLRSCSSVQRISRPDIDDINSYLVLIVEESLTSIRSGTGAIETFFTRPGGNGPFPAVILYMDIWGLREELFDLARRIATVGYCCLVPDLYHRQGKIRNGFRDAQGKMVSFARLSKEQQDIVLAPLRKLTDPMVVVDTAAILAFVDASEHIKHGAMGAIGYCMGGRYVLRAASAFPDRFKASACLHGTWLVTDKPDSPHRAATRAAGEIYCGFAELDPEGSPEIVDAFAASMRSSDVKYRYERHVGADHGYALPDRDIYHKASANRDWEIIFDMFRRQLQS